MQSLCPWYQSNAVLAQSAPLHSSVQGRFGQTSGSPGMEDVWQEFVGRMCLDSGCKRSSTPSALI